MNNQLSFFDYPKLKVNKPIRLIELFGGIGSQHSALSRINADFESYRLVEIDKKAVRTYNAIHGTNYIPSDITKIIGKDLGIVDTDKYFYIVTYSFPCQDLSCAGQGKGFVEGSGTRSSLLWEVKRLLSECNVLPQFLLFENVPQVISSKNIVEFEKWLTFLSDLGYTSKYIVLNSCNFGIPQKRSRLFMVSWLGKYNFDFPNVKKLNLTMRDFLEPVVDSKYFLSDKMKKYINTFNDKYHISKNLMVINRDIATTKTTREGCERCHICDYVSSDLPINANVVDVDLTLYRIRRLTPKECFRLMGFSDYEFSKVQFLMSDTQLYKLSGNSIVVNVLSAIFYNLFY